MSVKVSVKGRGGKPFTIENLLADKACEPGLKFVTPIIERGGDVALELKAAGFADWITWAIQSGYDCSSAWRDMDGSGNSFTWDEQARIVATARDYGTATAGPSGTATAGNYGTATAGEWGTATVGDGGTATAGDYSTAKAGLGGTAAAGDYGTATAGYCGTATAGYGGTASAGIGGVVCIRFYDGENYRLRCAEVDGVKIKANTLYMLNSSGEFVEVAK